MSRRPGRPTIRSSRPHMQWRTPLYAVILPIGGRPSPAAILCGYSHRTLSAFFGAPFPLFGSGVLLFAAKAYAPGRISTPLSHLDSTQTWRAHARRHLCPMCPPHRGPDPRPRPDEEPERSTPTSGSSSRPAARSPATASPHQPVLHLARTGHRRPAMAP